MRHQEEPVVSKDEQKPLSQKQQQKDINGVASSSQPQPNLPNSNPATDVKQPAGKLTPIDENKPLNQQQYNRIEGSSHTSSNQPKQKQPLSNLLTGPRADYLKYGVPLYEASIEGDWQAAKAILDEKPDYIRCSITENGETALHVAASSRSSKQQEHFVKNLVDMMTKNDLLLVNKNLNTALHLAVFAGNIKIVKIMLDKNTELLKLSGASGKMLPLYAAALFEKYEVVKYMYHRSDNLSDDDGWTTENRGWLLEKCVQNNMFDIALLIVKARPELAEKSNVLQVLARKPDAVFETKSNCIVRTIKSVFAFIGLKMGAPEKESEALELLRIIWKYIAKLRRDDIDNIIRGKPDLKQDDNQTSGKVIQALQLQKLISEYIIKIQTETQNIMKRPDSIEEDTNVASEKVNKAQQLHKLVSENIVNMHVETQNIIERFPNSSFKQETKPSSENGEQIQKLKKLISEHIVKMHVDTQQIITASGNGDPALSLQRRITEHTTILRSDTQKMIKLPLVKATYSARVLFIAAEMGNTRFLVELIRQYPDLIWKVNDNNQSIFHIAVKHRHAGIYNLLYEIGAMKDLITPLKDSSNDNTMLHLVGERAKKKRLEDVSGVALKMQRELLWFKEVESMIPSSYRDRKNKDGLTAYELFTREHKDLVLRGEEWMKGTANQCMVVAALIATIVFAAAFTIPGGYRQDDGFPMFNHKVTFMVFVVADAISLFSSSASILMFLSILTSRYAERDFLESLPKKLMLGLATLFLSITSMTVAFSVSFFTLYHHGLLWIPVLIGGLAVMPVLLYIKLQYALFVDVIRSTYGSRYLFKPRRHVLYYRNPQV